MNAILKRELDFKMSVRELLYFIFDTGSVVFNKNLQ